MEEDHYGERQPHDIEDHTADGIVELFPDVSYIDEDEIIEV